MVRTANCSQGKGSKTWRVRVVVAVRCAARAAVRSTAQSTQLKKSYREKKGEEWVEASKSHQVRFNSSEKNTIVDGRTATIKERLEQIENQIAFYSESIKTVDAVLFGVKTRLDVQKLLDGH